jgi:copper(I)-binding protein
MLPMPFPPRRRRGPARTRTRTAGPLASAATALTLGAALAGCAHAQASGPRIELGTGYVGTPQAGTTDAYLVIRNNGATDRLVSATSSAGGRVTLRGPASGHPAGNAEDLRNLAAITVPGHTLIRLDPTGDHLVITGSRPMKAGTEITLTLRFARSGTYQIAAEVTNAQTGGSSYFLN